jgi:hypothetical protein
MTTTFVFLKKDKNGDPMFHSREGMKGYLRKEVEEGVTGRFERFTLNTHGVLQKGLLVLDVFDSPRYGETPKIGETKIMLLPKNILGLEVINRFLKVSIDTFSPKYGDSFYIPLLDLGLEEFRGLPLQGKPSDERMDTSYKLLRPPKDGEPKILIVGSQGPSSKVLRLPSGKEFTTSFLNMPLFEVHEEFAYPAWDITAHKMFKVCVHDSTDWKDVARRIRDRHADIIAQGDDVPRWARDVDKDKLVLEGRKIEFDMNSLREGDRFQGVYCSSRVEIVDAVIDGYPVTVHRVIDSGDPDYHGGLVGFQD